MTMQMDHAGLDFITTEALVEELFRRKTFAGVMIYSPTTHKFDRQFHPNFNLITTVENQDAAMMLEAGLIALKNQ